MLGRLTYRKGGRLVHHEMIIKYYCCDNHVYDDVQFHAWSRMSRQLFLEVVEQYVASILILYKWLMQTDKLRLSS